MVYVFPSLAGRSVLMTMTSGSVFSIRKMRTLPRYCLSSESRVITWSRQAASSVRRLAHVSTWWRHQMEAFCALLALCAGNSPVTGEFPTQRPVTQSFDVFFDLRLNKWLSKQPRRRRVETPSRLLLHHSNDIWSCWLPRRTNPCTS